MVRVCDAASIPEKRAVVVTVSGERVAVFRYDGNVSAISNVCKHQNGPLGEGRIIDGCVTCPWHGYQYGPENGCSPPPFHDKVATYRTTIVNGTVFVDPNPLPEGTRVEPSRIPLQAVAK
jgi:nitrite reductase/ring-hydroxylating ferredoxin subunit